MSSVYPICNLAGSNVCHPEPACEGGEDGSLADAPVPEDGSLVDVPVSVPYTVCGILVDRDRSLIDLLNMMTCD